ncbi:CMGC protein kinase [Colletotrichum limetticola]|uniref:CMGC protein kinase n=1 Tax=Colletotrichum limetticola TaxID=1209924 RepID=A0ABQ9Q0M1_9PEZI|nr:CMGC protein kinase [Colletotrichum limetticola]
MTNAFESTLPSLQINDGPHISFPHLGLEKSNQGSGLFTWTHPQLPTLEDSSGNKNVQRHLEKRFQKNAVRDPFDSASNLAFWPSKLSAHLLKRSDIFEVVKNLLEKNALPRHGEEATHDSNTIDHSSERWTDEICGSQADSETYRLVFTILLLIDKAECIESFINSRLSDNSLPLGQDQIQRLYKEGDDHPELPFGDWLLVATANFQTLQSQLMVHFIRKAKIVGEVSHHDFKATQVLPWAYIPNEISLSSPDVSIKSLGGGFGEVRRVVIHAWQHDFHESLDHISDDPNCFALKRLYIAKKHEFEEEVKQLKRFGGRHHHIVTLLATFTVQVRNELEYFLLFPWADCDLLAFWERGSKQERNHQFFQWVAKQLCGISNAVSFIHDPGELDANGERIYGRHGDIKPENVLWFKSLGHGNLVLSDLGLTRTHRIQSRSNRPGEKIPVSPNYRPPECDIDGKNGKVSRSFDIWTLGCLFLEFVVWTLEGWEGWLAFRQRRMSPYIHGHDTPVYFEIVRVKGVEYAVDIKGSVTRDLIQTKMLIVQSEEPSRPRIQAPELSRKLEEIEIACKRWEYCMTPGTSTTTNEPHLPVRARLNNVALRHISNINARDAETAIRFKEGPSRAIGLR